MSFFSPDPPVTYRPLSLSVIGWWYAAGGAFGLLTFWVPLVIPAALEAWRTLGLEPGVLVGMAGVNHLFGLVAGTAILKRRSWGRPLLLASLGVPVVASAVLVPSLLGFSLAVNAMSFGILVYFLTRPAAAGYFDGSVTSMPAETRRVRRLQRGERTQSDVARVFGIILAFPGWWVLATATAVVAGVFVASIQAGESFPRLGGFWTFVLIAEGVGVALLGLGTLLWGRRRWKGYLGWGLLFLGVNAASFALLSILPFDPTQFFPPGQPGLPDAEDIKAFVEKAGLVAAIIGATLLSLGGLMVSAQRRHDHAAAAFMDADPTPSD